MILESSEPDISMLVPVELSVGGREPPEVSDDPVSLSVEVFSFVLSISSEAFHSLRNALKAPSAVNSFFLMPEELNKAKTNN